MHATILTHMTLVLVHGSILECTLDLSESPIPQNGLKIVSVFFFTHYQAVKIFRVSDMAYFMYRAAGLKICFNEIEGSSQCQQSRDTCSSLSSDPDPRWTSPFRDDTDDRAGGCQYQWSLVGTPQRNMVYRVCFKETEGSSQCQYHRSSCSGWSNSPSWTLPFRDDTDGRSGGCTYQWRIEEQPHFYNHMSACRICFLETEGSSQCQKNRGPTCSEWSTSPAPTDTFRDDTDGMMLSSCVMILLNGFCLCQIEKEAVYTNGAWSANDLAIIIISAKDSSLHLQTDVILVQT